MTMPTLSTSQKHARNPRWQRVLGTAILGFALLLPLACRAVTFEFVTATASTFALPHDVVLSPDGKRLFVADNGNHRIVVLAASDLQELGTFANDEVREPHDVAFDDTGRLLVADTGNSRIAIYSVDGARGTLVGELTGKIRRPEGVAALRPGLVLATGASSGNLVLFDGPTPIRELEGLSSPHDVAVDAKGRIWVADANNDRLIQVDEQLTILRELSGASYAFDGPRYLDFDAKGRLVVADKYANQIKVISQDGPTDGQLLLTFGSTKAGHGPGQFDRPEGVAIQGSDVWFADTYNNRIVKYRMTP